MYKNISQERLKHFYMKVMDIERKAFELGNLDLFRRCHFFNRTLWDEFWNRY